jgi:hypothetical protein
MEFQHAGFGGKHIPAGASSRSNPESYLGSSFNAAELMQ